MKSVILTVEQAAELGQLLASLPWGQVQGVMSWFKDLPVSNVREPAPPPKGGEK